MSSPTPRADHPQPHRPYTRTTAVLHVALAAAVGIGVAGAVVRGASNTRKFWEARNAMTREFTAQQRELGLAGSQNRVALYKQYPTPEITLCKPTLLTPGASATVTLTGKFAEKTAFLAGNDQVELSETALAAGKFTAKATAAADALPSYAPIYAFTPVSGAYNACHAVFVGPVTAYDLKGDNGWTIKLTPAAKAFAVKKGEASLPYQIAFFKDGEATPFKKMTTDLTIRESDEPGKDFYLSLNAQATDGSPEAELAALQKKMMDPQAYMKLPPKEQERIVNRMSELTELQIKKLSDPAAQQKMQQEQDDFGCSALSFQMQNGAARGYVTCGKNVGSRGRIMLTGSPATGAAVSPAN